MTEIGVENAALPAVAFRRKLTHALTAIGVIALVLACGFVSSWYLRFMFAGPTAAEYAAKVGPTARIVPAGELIFGGERLQCEGYPTLLQPSFPDYGAAYFGFIILNPERFETLPTSVKRFAYSHECGHQFVGYSEVGADCFAVKRGLVSGWLNAETLEEVCAFFSKAKGTAFHLPGPQRCAAIRACYNKQM